MRPMLRTAAAAAAVLYANSVMAKTPFERGVAALDAERYPEAIAAFTQAINEAPAARRPSRPLPDSCNRRMLDDPGPAGRSRGSRRAELARAAKLRAAS